MADKEGYKTYVIPDDVGGRFSVLTPVGLYPIAVAGFNINEIIKGAKSMLDLTSENIVFEENLAEKYALIRNLLYQNLYSIEVLVSYKGNCRRTLEGISRLSGSIAFHQNYKSSL